MNGRNSKVVELIEGDVGNDTADKARNRPSKRKGQRMNQFVAPTYFMMAISLRRAKTVRRMVLEMMNSMARVRKTMRQCRPNG